MKIKLISLFKRILLIISLLMLSCVGTFALAQLVPYGRNHHNPPVLQEPAWDSPQTRDLVRQACFDCHSDETVWPWYSNIAPVSWFIQYDVEEGRASLNFSEWQTSEDPGDPTESVMEHSMPPRTYLLLHRNARLTYQQKRQLILGLRRTLNIDASQ